MDFLDLAIYTFYFKFFSMTYIKEGTDIYSFNGFTLLKQTMQMSASKQWMNLVKLVKKGLTAQEKRWANYWMGTPKCIKNYQVSTLERLQPVKISIC